MPIKRCSSDGKSGYKWGDSGHCYTGKDGREKARKQGISIEVSKQKAGKPSEFDKALASLPTSEMITSAKYGLELRRKYNKGGENLIVLTIGQHIANGDFIPLEEVKKMRREYNKRARFSKSAVDTMGYINFMLLGGSDSRHWLDNIE